MERPSFRERLRYAFDNFMARGTAALVIGLFTVSAVIIFLIALLVQLTGTGVAEEPNVPFATALWRNLMRTLDAGTMGGDTGSVPFLALMLLVTLGGIFVISALIGVLSTGLDERLTEMRKGKSRVLESGHTVILGWSQQIYTVVAELVEANANQKGATIVVLADKDKVEMEDELRARLGPTGKTRIVCRSGRPNDLDEIDIANVQTSRAVIILSPESDEPDAEVLKALLAVTNDPNRRAEPYHVVAVLRNTTNVDVAKIVGKDEVELVVADDLIARITAQACRQSGLSVVYTDLLDYEGDEIYFTSQPSLVGKTFGDVLSSFDTSTVIGVHDTSSFLNPPMDRVIASGDQLIVIASDDDTIHLSNRQAGVRTDLLRDAGERTAAPERALVLGWNRRASTMISELDSYVPASSAVTVVARVSIEQDIADLRGRLERIELTFRDADTTDRSVLDDIDVGSFDHVIVLCYTENVEPQHADAQTLITLLHLRDIAERTGRDFSITSEMLDQRNRTLAEVSKADDFIVSDRLVSLLITQISENKHLGAVFEDLFDAEGAEIYLKPAGDYVALDAEVDFYTLTESARRRSEIAIGYRIAAHSGEAERQYGVVLNPVKSTSVRYAEDDRVIVLSSD
jgi:voltage-gated potassium channel Kch